jgi:hypothetical protein
VEPEDLRMKEKALELVRRAQREPEFATLAKSDPVGTLVAAGIPDTVALHLMAVAPDLCADGTCLTTWCGGTCYVTIMVSDIGSRGGDDDG